MKTTRDGMREVPGVRLKIRDDGPSLVATIWIDDKPHLEILRAPLDCLVRPGHENHHAFVDLANLLMRQRIKNATGLETVGRARKCSYDGETPPNG